MAQRACPGFGGTGKPNAQMQKRSPERRLKSDEETNGETPNDGPTPRHSDPSATVFVMPGTMDRVPHDDLGRGMDCETVTMKRPKGRYGKFRAGARLNARPPPQG